MSINKSTRVFNYFLMNSVFAACLYYGYVEHIEGAERIALTIAWFFIIVSFFLPSEEGVKVLKKNPRIIPRWLDVSFDIAVTAFLIFYGAVWTGAFYLLHMFLTSVAIEKAKEVNEEE